MIDINYTKMILWACRKRENQICYAQNRTEQNRTEQNRCEVEKFFAFTLAEVLITLGIIGVIAAMTIPTLISSYKAAITRTSIQTSYSDLSQATAMIKAENGNTLVNAFGSTALGPATVYNTLSDVALKYKDYLKIQKYCSFNNRAECFGDEGTGSWRTGYNFNISGSGNGAGSALILNNGITVMFDINSSHCEYINTTYFSIPSCGFVAIDSNGRKAPNKTSYDIFMFYMTKDGLIPMNDDNTNGTMNCSGMNNWGCTQYLLNGEDWESIRY